MELLFAAFGDRPSLNFFDRHSLDLKGELSNA